MKMKKSWILLLLLGVILVACTTPAATNINPTATSQPTNSLAVTLEPAIDATDPVGVPTETPTPVAVGGAVTFEIIPQESKITYEVGETFLNQNNRFSMAVGTTGQISGSITADPANLRTAEISPIEVDISQFKSDSMQRDRVIRNQWLESSRFPIAKFVPTKIEGLPQKYTEGSEYPLMVTGDLTVRNTTREVIFGVLVKLENNLLSGNATATLLMSDFGVGPISILGMLNTEDEVKLTFDFVARPQEN